MFDIYPIELNLIGRDLTEVLSWKDAKTVSSLIPGLIDPKQMLPASMADHHDPYPNNTFNNSPLHYSRSIKQNYGQHIHLPGPNHQQINHHPFPCLPAQIP